MSQIKFTCSSCAQPLEIDEAGAGMNVPCPHCGTEVLVPTASALPPKETQAPVAQTSPSSNPQQKPCPFCGEHILAIAKKCKHCGEFLDGSKREPQPNKSKFEIIENGKFAYSGNYSEVFNLVERALSDCEVKIKERSIERGSLVGKCSYGLNAFGITVTASFYQDPGQTRIDIAANLSDALDTFGACKKKVSQITDRLRSMSASPAFGNPSASPSIGETMPPSYSERTGPSQKGKAVTGLCFAIAGLLVNPFALMGIMAMIFSGIAITGMTTSKNKSGKAIAVAALIIGVIDTVWGLLYLMR